MKKKSAQTIKIELTLNELKAAFMACSNYTPVKTARVQARVVSKLSKALLNAVLNK